MKQIDILEARITALENALGALAMLALRQVPPAQQLTLAEGVAQMAATAERQHDQAGALLLTEIHRLLATVSGR